MMSKGSIVSIIMPAHNAQRYISEAIDSVLSQSVGNFELVIVNDGSTDDTESIVTAYKDKRIKLLSQPNKGVSAARNTGIRHASGDWLAFLDTDDKWLPGTLGAYSDSLDTVDFIFGEYKCMGGDRDGELAYSLSEEPDDRLGILNSLVHANLSFIGIGAVCVRKTLVGAGFDEKLHFGEDYKLWLDILYQEVRIKKITKPLYSYRVHSESAMQKTDDKGYQLAQILKSFSLKYPPAAKSAAKHYAGYIDAFLCDARRKGLYKLRPEYISGLSLPMKYRVKLLLHAATPRLLFALMGGNTQSESK